MKADLLVLLTPFLILAAGCGMPAPIRVMSFNIRYANDRDGENGWSHRRDQVIELIRESGADVVGLQEVLATQLDELVGALGEYAYVGRGRGLRERDGEFVPILFNKQRFMEVKHGHFWLSEKPRKPGSKSWDAQLPRMVTWVQLRYRKSLQNTFYVINTHFDHAGQQARLESARMLRNTVESRAGNPLIVLGDFNCAPQSDAYEELTTERGNLAELYDPFVELNLTERAVGTYHGFDGEPDSARIDWILFNRRWWPRDIWIDQRAHDGRYPSDHFPVIADLELMAATKWGAM